MAGMLGVLGGMGPLASAQFMLRLTLLTPAERDQDHVPAVLWSDPHVPDRAAAWGGTGPDSLPMLVRGLQGLAVAGCGAVAIPCNTAHGWIDGMRAATALPIRTTPSTRSSLRPDTCTPRAPRPICRRRSSPTTTPTGTCSQCCCARS